jgi:hypothetical protein
MSFPVIFTALEFYKLPNGKRTHHTHHIAAFTAKQAIASLHECAAIDFSECWITSDNVREMDTRAAVQTRIGDFRRGEDLDENAYRSWVRVMSRDEWHDGQFTPAAWLRVPAPLKAAA